MAGRRELGFPNSGACSLKEQLARTTLRNVRLQGHTYVELREDGKKFIFFCTLCLAPCYSDAVLFDHLKGNLHNGRLAAAKATLLKPNPWPFSDGVLFFQDSTEQDKDLLNSSADRYRLLNNRDVSGNEFAIVAHGEPLSPSIDRNISQNGSDCNGEDYCSTDGDADCDAVSTDRHTNDASCDNSSCDGYTDGFVDAYKLVVPGVLRGDEISSLEVRFIGVGQIAARFFLKDEVPDGICRIWCEWLGMSKNVHSPLTLEHDFAVVTFSYNFDLGRKGLLEDVKYLLSSSPGEKAGDVGDVEDARKKRKKSFSDPEDISESLSNQYDSSGEDSPYSNSSSSRMLLDGYDDQLLHSRFISSKTLRRELRRQQRLAAERMCDICQQKMLPGKDVATILNRKTGRLVCSSRNKNGAFHVFHISCLIHWILLCEFEVYTKDLVSPKVKRRPRRKTGSKRNGSMKEGEIQDLRKHIYCAFCPECQGTGIDIDGDELEKPTVPLSEMFRYKIKLSDARRAWMKSPEDLQNCSTGFYFPSQSNEPVEETVSPMKLLYFYRADG
ncbi:hypothetical protein NMG60_11035573 [Bertholletia excelsa]